MLVFCLDCGVPTALDVLHSSLPRVPCLCLVDRVAGLGLAAGGCESSNPFVLLGDDRPRNLLLLSSHEAPAVVDLLDSTCKDSNFSLSPSALCTRPWWFRTHKKKHFPKDPCQHQPNLSVTYSENCFAYPPKYLDLMWLIEKATRTWILTVVLHAQWIVYIVSPYSPPGWSS